MEQIHLLCETVREAPRKQNHGPDPQDESGLSVSASPDVFSEYDIAEFAGDALAPLEDWEVEIALEDLQTRRTKIQ